MLDNINNVTINDLDNIIDHTTNIFINSARNLNMVKVKHKSKKRKKENNKPWFNFECKKDRKSFYKAKHRDSRSGQDDDATAERKRVVKNTKKLFKKV